MVWFVWERSFDLLVGGNGWKISMASSGSGKKEARIGVEFVSLNMLRGGRGCGNWQVA